MKDLESFWLSMLSEEEASKDELVWPSWNPFLDAAVGFIDKPDRDKGRLRYTSTKILLTSYIVKSEGRAKFV